MERSDNKSCLTHPQSSNHQRFMESTFSSRQKLAVLADRQRPPDTTSARSHQKCRNQRVDIEAPPKPSTTRLTSRDTPKKRVARDNEAHHDHSNKLSLTVAKPRTWRKNSYHPEATLVGDHNGSQDQHPSITTTSTNPVVTTQLRDAHDFVISGNPTLTNIGVNTGVSNVTTVNNYGGTHGLEKMESSISFGALHNSSAQEHHRQCHPGTRQNVLKRMKDWIEDPNTTERILWLYGPAGAGKSAIAQTIARLCIGSVVATFFFYRSNVHRNDGNRLFITIAWQLAFSIPAIKDHIVHSLDQCPHLPTSDVETQFDQLIAWPCLQTLKDALSQHSAPVVLIDGVDECIDEKLQLRFLDVIGNAVRDSPIPLRFLISSRHEAHIEDTIGCFQPILRIDLAKLDDANRDIEKYLVDQFSRIASKQGLDSAWPGKKKILIIVCKSSGNFIYASTVIQFVDDGDNIATSQLDIVLNLKPIQTMSPFAALDQLYLEILRGHPDQVFLKTFLALWVFRSSIRTDRSLELHRDDAILMNVSEKELHIKLRRMRSLMKFKPWIDVHHRSFLDFLQEPSRSSQYFVSKQGGRRQYLELIVDLIVRCVSQVIEQPNSDKTSCFRPEFAWLMRDFPPNIVLPVEQWEEALQPLLQAQNKLLKMPNFSSTWNPLPIYKPTAFDAMRDLLLHFAFLQGTSSAASAKAVDSVGNETRGKYASGISSTATGTEQNVLKTDLDACLSSLLALLPESKESSMSTVIVGHMCSVLRFDYPEIAMKVRSIADAQRLLDLIVHLIDDKDNIYQHNADAMRKLALEIFDRVPILPRSLFSNRINRPHHNTWTYKERHFPTLCQTALVGRILDHNHIVPVLEILEEGGELIFFSSNYLDQSYESIMQWRRRSNPSLIAVVQMILGVARAIRYLHSMDIVLHFGFNIDDVFLDSESRPKIRYLGAASSTLRDNFAKQVVCYKNNIFSFGHIFYEVYFGVKSHDNFCRQDATDQLTSDPRISAHARDLVQHCCAVDPKSRPTIDEVVKKLERWG